MQMMPWWRIPWSYACKLYSCLSWRATSRQSRIKELQLHPPSSFLPFTKVHMARAHN
jgi:hypothetical protein